MLHIHYIFLIIFNCIYDGTVNQNTLKSKFIITYSISAQVAHIEPIQRRYYEVMSDESYLDEVLRDGQRAADEVAEQVRSRTRRRIRT